MRKCGERRFTYCRICLVGVSLLMGCGPSAAAIAPATAAPTPGSTIDLEPCTLGSTPALCGALRVYEDRTSSMGRTIDLRVAVIKAQSPNPAADPIFYLAGGPGVAATEDAAKGPQFPYDLAYAHDLVFVDQRGTGGSNRVVIPPGPDLSGLSQAEMERTAEQWASGVLEEIDQHMDPRFYTTSVAMDDLDEVREALGYDKINLFGHSYGATAAQYYLRQHEEHVRSVILSGGTLLDTPLFELWARNGQRAMDLLLAQCEADSACHTAYPGLRTELAGLLERLGREPKVIEPADPASDSITFTGDLLAEVLRVMMLDSRQAAGLPGLVHRAYADDEWTGIVNFYLRYGPGDWGSQVMEHVIRCYEKWAVFEPDVVAELSEGSYLKGWYVSLAQNHGFACRLTPRGEMPEGTSTQPHSDVPVLILNGAWDPQCPPENMAGSKDLWPNSLALVEPYQGHWLSDGSEIRCRWSIEAQFVELGTVEGVDTNCLKEVQPPVFVVGE